LTGIDAYFRGIGHPIPSNTNPAEFLLDIVSSDFGNAKDVAQERVQLIQNSWAQSQEADAISRQVLDRVSMTGKDEGKVNVEDMARPGPVRITGALLHRSFIKSYRDVVAYGIRIVMYLGTCYAQFSVFRFSMNIGNGTNSLQVSPS
jgi:hypothetical protein